ncbi:MAG: hypothetical protein H8D75_00695 [Rhodospirillaceae bacterium]|nr:hypothetical protein [Rhodospirillaceae bacterium]
MSIAVKKLAALAISVPIGLGLTSAVLWIFGIEVASIDRWIAFPTDWRIFDLITNSVAVLMVFGTIRAAYRVLLEVWIKEKPVRSNLPTPPDGAG